MIRIHHCAGQIDVAEERKDPPAPKCRCRKFISIDKATKMVKNGEASWVVVKRISGYAEVVCPMCVGDKTIANCANCNGKGVIIDNVVWNTYNNDIVLISALPEDKTEKKRSSVLKKKTPRVATIEKAHIERAYVYDNKEAQERIEEYGRLTNETLTSFIVGPEPEDNPKTGEGRKYDFGRKI
jgi:hypothetical protein